MCLHIYVDTELCNIVVSYFRLVLPLCMFGSDELVSDPVFGLPGTPGAAAKSSVPSPSDDDISKRASGVWTQSIYTSAEIGVN